MKQMLRERMVVPVVQKLCFTVGAVAGNNNERVLLQINFGQLMETVDID